MSTGRPDALDDALDDAVETALAYGKTLLGVPRGDNHHDDVVGRGDACPYWCADALPPPTSVVRTHGTNCAGLVNLMLRAVKGHPTAVSCSAADADAAHREPSLGDTRNWFSYLTHQSCLHPFCETDQYPAGTLLLRDYNERDHGHMAVVLAPRDEHGVLHARLLHSVGWDDGGELGVRIDETVGRSHFFQYDGEHNCGHYTHVCAPRDWLTIRVTSHV